jgi:hypothetical protein
MTPEISMSALPPKADIKLTRLHVRFVSIADVSNRSKKEAIRSPRPRAEIQGRSADNGGAALQRGRCADQGDRNQSTLMFAARMTLAHFSVVSARSLA